MPKLKISNATYWMILKHCVGTRFLHWIVPYKSTLKLKWLNGIPLGEVWFKVFLVVFLYLMTQKQLSGQRSVKCVVWSLQMETTYKGVVGWFGWLSTTCATSISLPRSPTLERFTLNCGELIWPSNVGCRKNTVKEVVNKDHRRSRESTEYHKTKTAR